MPHRLAWAALALVVGAAGGFAAGYLLWGRSAAVLADRVAALETASTQVQGERERLRHELGDIVRERREMATTAEHLRTQVDEQLRRLEALTAELAPPPEPDAPGAIP
jgi:hypothetical protein